ncbi:hypothetical protein R6Q59_025101 [Mikania micrantha]
MYQNTVSFANGKSSPFLSFFDVDYVYFSFCVENNEWLLVQVELRNVNLVMYCSECFSRKNYRRTVHPKLMKISVYFCALLVNIKYFKKTGFPEKMMSFEVNEDYVQSHTDLYGNQGVHACMLMEHLVTRKPLNITNASWPTKYTFGDVRHVQVIESPIPINIISFFIPFLNARKVCKKVYRRVYRNVYKRVYRKIYNQVHRKVYKRVYKKVYK